MPGEEGELCGLNAPLEKGLVATGEKAPAPKGVLIPGLAPGLNLRSCPPGRTKGYDGCLEVTPARRG